MKAVRRIEMKFAAPRMAILIPIIALLFGLLGAIVGQKILGGRWSGAGQRERVQTNTRPLDEEAFGPAAIGELERRLDDLAYTVGEMQKQESPGRASEGERDGSEYANAELKSLRKEVTGLHQWKLEANQQIEDYSVGLSELGENLRKLQGLVGPAVGEPSEPNVVEAISASWRRLKEIEERLDALSSSGETIRESDPEKSEDPVAPTTPGTSNPGDPKGGSD